MLLSLSEGIIGRRFGFLTVVDLSTKKKGHNRLLRCVCDCGSERLVVKSVLLNGRAKSCGCRHIQLGSDLSGLEFGRWTVISRLGGGYWECLCLCGVKRKVNRSSMTRGDTLSCGCLTGKGDFPKNNLE